MLLELSTLIAVAGFSFATSASPGPNTLLLASSGARFGLKQTLPHMLGVNIGILIMMLAGAIGLGSLLQSYPLLQLVMRLLCTAYLLYLAWKLASDNTAEANNKNQRPVSFFQAITIQWINPKVWMMVVTAMSVFPTAADDTYLASALQVAIVMAVINLPSIALWVTFGSTMRKMLKTPQQQRGFCIGMGLLTAATAAVIWI